MFVVFNIRFEGRACQIVNCDFSGCARQFALLVDASTQWVLNSAMIVCVCYVMPSCSMQNMAFSIS